MDAESKDLLRDWLIRSLEPVCDADPEVLSKYVLALIQNDPKKDGLQETCISKLEEFLGDGT
uniref:PWI domain-containing protein n=1 Tax=Globisporangium ultimum (strain ATCC 200006 / CBS 805.95 / DAOM BR144) TaxID=431595 RepID=K3XBP9_GLOUD